MPASLTMIPIPSTLGARFASRWGLLKEPVVAALFIEYAFYSIQIRLDGKPTVIYIEEAWFMLAYERFAAGIDNWLRTLAKKKNAFLIMATQSLSEVANSKIFASIIDNIPNRIFPAKPKCSNARRNVPKHVLAE